MNNIFIKYSFFSQRIFYLFITLCLTSSVFCQKEVNNWYFGKNAGISFNASKSYGLKKGSLYTSEGCAAISNNYGQLLFYTDGIRVWDSTHRVTPNGIGLNGHWSSTQSALVVPRPGYTGNYYIFTVDYEAGSNGLQYSEFDMSLNSGKGDVVSTFKNVKLLDYTCEKIAVVKHYNGIDYWVCAHKFGSDTIYSFLVTMDGINKMAIKSGTGINNSGGTENTLGYMKFSPDGTKIAYANWAFDNCCIGDFDVKTGRVSNVWSFPIDDAYGVEFSATSNFLYISEMFTPFNIFQYNAKAATIDDFIDSKVCIDSRKNGIIGALQIGPDKKIYICRYDSKFLDVIHFPDSNGKKCRVQYDYVDLMGNVCKLGLPTFIQSYFNPNYNYYFKGECFGDTTWFSIGDTTGVDSLNWFFGDANSGTMNNAKGYKVFHLFSDTGNYKVCSIAFKGKFKDSTYMNVSQRVNLGDFNKLGKDLNKCPYDSVKLSFYDSNSTKYVWNTGVTNEPIFVNKPSTISIKSYYGNYCYRTDTIKIDNYLLPKFTLGPDTFFCPNKFILLGYLHEGFSKYQWSTGSNSRFLNPKSSGMYTLEITDRNGCKQSDTINVSALFVPEVNLGNDTTYCNFTGKIILDAKNKSNFSKFIWGNGHTLQTDTITQAGKYWVTVTNPCGSASDSIQLSFYKIPNPDIGPNKVYCDTMNPTFLSVKVTNIEDTYQWSNGDTDTSTTFINTGKHWLKIISPCGVVSDTVVFRLSQSPKVFLGKDTSLCGHFNFNLDAGNSGMNYEWSPFGETTQKIIADKQTTYKVVVTNSDGCSGNGELTINDDCISNYWFPNSFTPNTDQLNETFKPLLVNFENYEMKIFNRWGELIFETDNIEKGWDGTYKNSICQAGVYFYISNFVSTENNKKHIIKGTITLLK